MRKIVLNLSLAIILLLLCQITVCAQPAITLQVSETRARVGDEIRVSGTTVANAWVNIKGLDADGNIVYYNAVCANESGTYSNTFKTPAMSNGTLTIIAGSGVDVESASVQIYKSSGGGSGGGSGGSGGSSGGSGDSSLTDPATTIRITTPTDGNTDTITAIIKITTCGTPGIASAVVGEGVTTALIEQAQKSEKAGQKVVMEIKLEAPVDARTNELTIPRTFFDNAADKTGAAVKVNTELGTITFNSKAVDSINNAADRGDVSVSITKVDTSALSKKMQKTIGDRPVYDLSVKAGKTEISSFGEGSAQVSIPYAPKPGEKINAIVVYYIDNKGKLNPVRGKYDPTSGTINFSTRHFSEYVIGYNEIKFNDVPDSAWYSNAVGFIASRSIATGTGNGNFSPQLKLTRGQFITMLMRAYAIEPDENPPNNFADAGNTYYTGYLAAAKQLDIAGGTGNNMFAPEDEITRQEVFSLLYRTLKTLDELPDNKLPKGKSEQKLTSFCDAAQIAPWARDAMTCFANTGTISGNGGNLSPTATTNRAEMAQVLYNLLIK